MRGKAILVVVLTCVLVLGLAGAAFAGQFSLPPGTVVSPSGIVLANVRPSASVEHYNPGVMVLEEAQVNVKFQCADAETVRVLDFGGFSQYLPVAVDVKTGQAYAVLPQKPRTVLNLGRWCGYDAPVEVGNSFSVVAKLCHAIIDRKHRL